MRLRDVAASDRRLLKELSTQISTRLESEFTELANAEGPNIGVELRERGHKVLIEIPGTLLTEAQSDATVRETVRVRIKARRDRMLFRAPPEPLPKRVAAAPDPAGPRFGFGRGGPGRGRR